jgi:IQ calmodulin-binding motif
VTHALLGWLGLLVCAVWLISLRCISPFFAHSVARHGGLGTSPCGRRHFSSDRQGGSQGYPGPCKDIAADRAQRHTQRVAFSVALQTAWRARQARKQLRELRAAVVVQRHVRGAQARRRLAQLARAALAVQATWRRFRQEREYRRLRSAALCVQAAARGWQQRRDVRRLREAAVTVQARNRGWASSVGRHTDHGAGSHALWQRR